MKFRYILSTAVIKNDNYVPTTGYQQSRRFHDLYV